MEILAATSNHFAHPRHLYTSFLFSYFILSSKLFMEKLDSLFESFPQSGKRCLGVWKVFGFVVAVIMFYFCYLITRASFDGNKDPLSNIHKYDFMNIKLFNMSLLENCCSMWPLSHFILFFFLGVLFPDCPVPIIAGGVLWEVLEMIMSYVFKRNRQAVRSMTGGSLEYSKNWMQGSMKDIVFDILGYVIGRQLIISTGKRVKLPSFLYCDNQ